MTSTAFPKHWQRFSAPTHEVLARGLSNHHLDLSSRHHSSMHVPVHRWHLFDQPSGRPAACLNAPRKFCVAREGWFKRCLWSMWWLSWGWFTLMFKAETAAVWRKWWGRKFTIRFRLSQRPTVYYIICIYILYMYVLYIYILFYYIYIKLISFIV